MEYKKINNPYVVDIKKNGSLFLFLTKSFAWFISNIRQIFSCFFQGNKLEWNNKWGKVVKKGAKWWKSGKERKAQ